MMDESTETASIPAFSSENVKESGGQNPAEPTVAFCQECGRGLTASGVRTVGSSILCEACTTQNKVPSPEKPPGVAPDATTGGYVPVHSPTMDGVTPLSPVPGQPNPALAGLFGLIPGVGAMYNGQYLKGVIHLVIFVVLTSLADNLNWVLWWFVWGWIFYQAVEAYHTAQAKRDGMPLPDPFGWNDLGDRLGFGRTSPPVPSSRYPARPVPEVVVNGQSTQTQAAAPHTANPAPPFAAHKASPAQAAGRVDPVSSPASWTAPPAESAYPPPLGTVTEAPLFDPLNTGGQYSLTYTGGPVKTAVPSNVQALFGQRFPSGAVWLIGLGVLFLVGNLAPGWRFEQRWLIPALLGLVAVWIGGRRIQATISNRNSSGISDLAALAEGLVGAAILLTLAVLLALQNAYIVPLRHSWPAVLIVWGALLLVGRARSATASLTAEPSSPPEPVSGSAPLR